MFEGMVAMQKKRAGRHKSDNPRTFDLSKIRLTREERRMIEIKAILQNNGDMAKYIRDLAIHDNRPPKALSACRCGSTSLHIVYEDEEYPIKVGDEDRILMLKGVPRSVCDECGQVLGDMRLAVKIESAIDEEILWRLNQRRDIPSVMEFDELIYVKN
jgi:hypothetical protein